MNQASTKSPHLYATNRQHLKSRLARVFVCNLQFGATTLIYNVICVCSILLLRTWSRAHMIYGLHFIIEFSFALSVTAELSEFIKKLFLIILITHSTRICFSAKCVCLSGGINSIHHFCIDPSYQFSERITSK